MANKPNKGKSGPTAGAKVAKKGKVPAGRWGTTGSGKTMKGC